MLHANNVKKISNQHTKNKVDNKKLEEIHKRIKDAPIGDFPLEILINHLNTRETIELLNQIEINGYSPDCVHSKTYNKYVLQVKMEPVTDLKELLRMNQL